MPSRPWPPSPRTRLRVRSTRPCPSPIRGPAGTCRAHRPTTCSPTSTSRRPTAPSLRGVDSDTFDSLPDGIVVADGEGTVTLVNDVARRLLGPDAKPGQPLREVMALQDRESSEWYDATTPYAGIGSRVGLPEASWFTADGTEVLVTGRLNREARGGPI